MSEDEPVSVGLTRADSFTTHLLAAESLLARAAKCSDSEEQTALASRAAAHATLAIAYRMAGPIVVLEDEDDELVGDDDVEDEVVEDDDELLVEDDDDEDELVDDWRRRKGAGLDDANASGPERGGLEWWKDRVLSTPNAPSVVPVAWAGNVQPCCSKAIGRPDGRHFGPCAPDGAISHVNTGKRADGCPCGCGRRLGFGERRMANRAVYIESLLPAYERLLQQTKVDVWKRLYDDGRWYAFGFWGEAHQDPMGPLAGVSVNELRRFRRGADDWEAVALRAAKRLRREDLAFRASWQGPSRKL
jgi:hypothetical protein